MPVKVRILFYLEDSIPVKELFPERIHALFFAVLPEKISQEIHSIGGIKPFTVCSDAFFLENEESEVKKVKLTITLLRDELFPFLSEGIILGRKLNIGGIKITGRKIVSLKHKTYEELVEEGKATKDFLFYFKTPTTFKKGDADYPVPEPVLIFKSLLKRWNSYSERKFQLSSEKLRKTLQIGGLWIRTRKLPVSQNAKLTGFTGRVFINARTEDEDTLRKLHTLSLFAEFSGIGRKVTMGFGKALLLKC